MDNMNERRRHIVALCKQPPPGAIISNMRAGYNVVKIDDHSIVKFGRASRKSIEARNQQVAIALVDPTIVRIPKVLDYFDDDKERGYLVMEYIAGRELEAHELNAIHYEKLRIVLRHFAQIEGQEPGNLAGSGPMYQCPFPDEGAEVENLSAWFTARICDKTKTIRLDNKPLQLCHRDLALRNILWQSDDQPVVVIDWVTAGFLPAEFELASQLNQNETHFSGEIAEMLKTITTIDEQCTYDLLRVWFNCHKYAFTHLTEPQIPVTIPQISKEEMLKVTVV